MNERQADTDRQDRDNLRFDNHFCPESKILYCCSRMGGSSAYEMHRSNMQSHAEHTAPR